VTALTEALDVVCHHFGHQHQITAERQVLDNVPFEDFDAAERARLSPIIGLLRNTPVLVLDLHGDRANDAESQLEALRLPLVVVYHGKGTGVLADVVDEFVERDGRYVVGGRSGATLSDRRHGMTLLVERELAARIVTETRARHDLVGEGSSAGCGLLLPLRARRVRSSQAEAAPSEGQA
jgi:hypothetical protein